MEVRPARVEDAARIAVVHVRSWQEAYRGLLPQEYLDRLDPAQRVSAWKRAIERPDSSRSGTMVIDRGDALLGFVTFGPTRDEDDNPERVGEIRALYLLPNAWRHGFGRELMAAALKRLAEEGFEQVTLWVLDSNVRARSFYEAGGWSADGSLKDDDSRGFPLTEMRYRKPLR